MHFITSSRSLPGKFTNLISKRIFAICMICRDFNVPVSFIPADLTSQAEVRHLAETAINQHPPGPDILINNAGI